MKEGIGFMVKEQIEEIIEWINNWAIQWNDEICEWL